MKEISLYIQMFVLLILWGSFAAVSKLTLQNLDGFQVLFLMFAAAFLIMTAVHLADGRLGGFFRITPSQAGITLLIALPSFLYNLLYLLALKRIPAIEASILNYLFPIFIILFSVAFDHEKLQLYKIGSIVLGFAGIAVIISNGNLQSIRFTNIAGDLLAIGAAASWGFFSVLGKKNRMDLKACNYLYTAASLIFSLICVLLFSRVTMPELPALGGIVWLGASNIVLAYALWFSILKRTSAVMASSMSFITPFMTFLFIVLLLHEKMTSVHILGLVLVMSGFILQYVPQVFYRKKREKTSSV